MWVKSELFSTYISYRCLKLSGGVHIGCRPIFRQLPEKSLLLGTWKVGGIHSGKASLHNGYLLLTIQQNFLVISVDINKQCKRLTLNVC